MSDENDFDLFEDWPGSRAPSWMSDPDYVEPLDPSDAGPTALDVRWADEIAANARRNTRRNIILIGLIAVGGWFLLAQQ